MREAGCTASQEIALTLANAIYYSRMAIKNGMEIDDFAPRMSFFFACHNNFIEEASKFRAARQLWYELIEHEFAPTNPKSSQLRFHTQTSGVTLTAQQPINNAIRVAYQALSAVLGGTQSLHTNSFDEALGLPTEDSAQLALRTQQIIAEELGITEYVDPLGGSPYIEEKTDQLIHEARSIIEDIEKMGGAMECVKAAFQHFHLPIPKGKTGEDLARGRDAVPVSRGHRLRDEPRAWRRTKSLGQLRTHKGFEREKPREGRLSRRLRRAGQRQQAAQCGCQLHHQTGSVHDR